MAERLPASRLRHGPRQDGCRGFRHSRAGALYRMEDRLRVPDVNVIRTGFWVPPDCQGVAGDRRYVTRHDVGEFVEGAPFEFGEVRLVGSRGLAPDVFGRCLTPYPTLGGCVTAMGDRHHGPRAVRGASPRLLAEVPNSNGAPVCRSCDIADCSRARCWPAGGKYLPCVNTP